MVTIPDALSQWGGGEKNKQGEMKLSWTGLMEFLIKLLGMKVADTYSLHAEPNLVTIQVPLVDLSIDNYVSLKG